MSETQAPAYLQCSLCGFWVTKEQGSCPNCGIPEPDTEWRPFAEEVGGAGVTVIGMVGGIAALGTAGVIALLHALNPGSGMAQDMMEWINALSVGAGLVIGGGMAGIVGYYRHRFKRPRPRDCFQQIEASLISKLTPPNSLRQTEEQLCKRIEELQATGQDSGKLQEALATVREALKTAGQHSGRAKFMLEKIAMLRWQNKLEPLIMASPSVSDPAEWKRRLERLEAIQTAGEKMAEEFSARSDQFEGGRALQATWSQLLEGCERLENEMLARQAMAAVESAELPAEQVAGEDTLPAQMALRDFLITHDFGDLDRSVRDLRRQETELQAARGETEQAARQVQMQ